MPKTVKRLNVTPVKSTALHHPEQIRLEPFGAVDNRDFYFVDGDGRLFAGSKLGPLVQIRADHDRSATSSPCASPTAPSSRAPPSPTVRRSRRTSTVVR